jgi:phospholipase C
MAETVPTLKHIFVLMLENRSFDHMLGFSGISGSDAFTRKPTAINGLSGSEYNIYNNQRYTVTKRADWSMQHDPGHEFDDTVMELCGKGHPYFPGLPYPAVDCSGFVQNYAEKKGVTDPGEIMMCQDPSQIPVLMHLAQEFVVCDNWYSSLPGPTWPNRFFVNSGSSGGLDHSPSTAEIYGWMNYGFNFPNGTIFHKPLNWRVYADTIFPISNAVVIQHGWPTSSPVRQFSSFAADVNRPDYPAQYTFIEPNYGHFYSDYKRGNSQHPLDTVIGGEIFIQRVYNAIRSSPVWNSSALIITWDEHGGFYDHVPPPKATAPGDTQWEKNHYTKFGFTFEQLGVRVPAVIVSPLISRNLIDHTVFDHSSIAPTVEAQFGLGHLTERDRNAYTLLGLFKNAELRTDTLPKLEFHAEPAAPEPGYYEKEIPVRPMDSVDEGNSPAFLYLAYLRDLTISPQEKYQEIKERVQSIKTRGEAADYVNEVRAKAAGQSERAAAAGQS